MKSPFSPLLLILATCLLGGYSLPAQEPAPAAEEEKQPEKSTEEKVKELFAKLGADEFRVREAAMVELWELGDKAEPFIRDAAKGGDIELRTRSARLLTLYKYGIFPDTPPKILAIINQFRHGDINARTAALRQLYTAGEMASVAKLIRTVEDAATRNRFVRAVVDELDERLAEMFAKEKFDVVESLLQLAAISDEGLRDLSGFYLSQGTLDEKLDELLAREKAGELNSLEYEQLAWHFRFKGDLDSALAAASSSENKLLATGVRIAQGDLLALIKSSYNPNDRTIQAFGFTAAAQRLSGDDDGFKRTIKTIKQYASDHPDEVVDCLEALIVNGALDAALEITAKGTPERLQFLIDRGDHLAALKELGVDDPSIPLDKWLTPIEKEFATIKNGEDYNRVFGPPFNVAAQLKEWGEDAKAAEIIERFGRIAAEDIAERDRAFILKRFITNASGLGMRDIALKYARIALAQEAADAAAGHDLPGVDPDEQRIRNRIGRIDAEAAIVGELFHNRAQSAMFWWAKLKEKFAAENSLERLERLMVLLGEEKEPALELLKKLEPEDDIKGLDRDTTAEYAEHLSRVASLYSAHDETDTAKKFHRAALALPTENISYSNFLYALVLADEEKWEDSLPHFKAASKTDRVTGYYLTYYGVALERAGKKEEAAKILRRCQLQALGRPSEYSWIARAFRSLGEHQRAREMSQIAINIALVGEGTAQQECANLANYLVQESPARAAMYKERYLIPFLFDHVPLANRDTGEPLFSLGTNVRGAIGALQALADLRGGRNEEAVEKLRALVAKQPSNSSLIEDSYPMLVKAGLQTEADELYEQLNAYGENALALFPNSVQDLNSNAWLKARCGKDLDTALVRSKRSNELSKDNYAYLDTLAEIHFQRGDRDKAIELSTKAVDLASADFLLSRQLDHFKNDQPLSESLK